MSTSIRYVAEVKNVTEVSLLASADFQFWAQHLKPYRLNPLQKNGRAELLMTAAKMRWMGIPFVEVSFSILLESPQYPNTAFLLQAFNSSGFFAFCEREFFQTPYTSAKCTLSIEPSLSIRLGEEKNFEAAGHNSFTSAETASLWKGPVYIPVKDPRSERSYFFAHLEGTGATRPFDPNSDSIKFSPAFQVFAMLKDSDFRGEQWLLRKSALHKKSRTHTTSLTNNLARMNDRAT